MLLRRLHLSLLTLIIISFQNTLVEKHYGNGLVERKTFWKHDLLATVGVFLISWVILYLYFAVHSSIAPSPPKTNEGDENKTKKENNSIASYFACRMNKPLLTRNSLCSNLQVLVYESGAVEIHKLSSLFSSASGDELDTFASFLDRVIWKHINPTHK